MDQTLAQRFAPIIKSLGAADLGSTAVLRNHLRLDQDGEVEVCYAPFEYVNAQARIVVVGITPGQTQMNNAVHEFHRQLRAGSDLTAALRAAKQVGAFSGAMRSNLIRLLDSVGLQRWLGIGTCEDLFGKAGVLMQTTSLLRNPVFYKGEDYNGTPNMVRHPLLRRQLEDGFGMDAQSLKGAVFVLLGDKVAEAMAHLTERGIVDPARVLSGLPHPSGANAERIAYFVGDKARATLSSKTDPDKLDRMREQTLRQLAALR